MAKHIRQWNKSICEEYLKKGKGQGEMCDYIPWISVQDFSSRGTVSRIYSYKTHRVHHLLSRNELLYFYLLEWSDNVLDIREQYPLLDLELAEHLAKKANIRYPHDTKSKYPYILTCDFMITTKSGLKARTIKSTKDLSNPRVLEKLEVERQYWQTKGVDWGIVTEKQIPFQKAQNLQNIYSNAVIPKRLDNSLYKDYIISRLPEKPIDEIAIEFDKVFNENVGSGICIIKNMLWNKVITFNMNQRIFSC